MPSWQCGSRLIRRVLVNICFAWPACEQWSALTSLRANAGSRRVGFHTRLAYSEAHRPNNIVILEAQTNGIPIAICLLTADDPCMHGHLVQHRSDFRYFAQLPRMVGNHARTMSADVKRVCQLGFIGELNVSRSQVHNHRDREPLIHLSRPALSPLAAPFVNSFVLA